VEITPTSVVPAAPPELSDVVSGARASALEVVKAMDAARASATPALQPEPPAATEPVVAAPATTSTVPVPDSGQVPPAPDSTAITIDPSSLSPEALRALKVNGGLSAEAVARALARYTEFDNRLGKRGQAAEAAQPASATPDVTPPAGQPEPPAVPQEITPEVIEAHASRQASTDPECRKLDEEYGRATANLKAIADKYPTLDVDFTYLERRFAEVKETDPAEAESIREQLFDLKEARNARTLEEIKQRDSFDRFQRRLAGHRQAVATHFDRESRARAAAQAEQDAIYRHAEEMEQAWPAAEAAAMKAHSLDPSLAETLRKRAGNAALANLSLGMRITDLGQFLDSEAKALKNELVEFHRLQAVEHGRLAHVRTDQVAPPPGTTPGAMTKAPDNAPLSLADIQRQARLDARTRVLGR
jgi:hypothetical protein